MTNEEFRVMLGTWRDWRNGFAAPTADIESFQAFFESAWIPDETRDFLDWHYLGPTKLIKQRRPDGHHRRYYVNLQVHEGIARAVWKCANAMRASSGIAASQLNADHQASGPHP